MKNITITTAIELTSAKKTSLESKISKKVGSKAKFSYKVNPNLIGGITIAIDSKLYDGSVKYKLETIKQALYSNL